MNETYDIIVSGHLCLDMIPDMSQVSPESLNLSGRLIETGAIDVSTGGVVSNTGLALQRLGMRVGLMAIVGDDLLGHVITSFLNQRDPKMSALIKTEKGKGSSYSVVLSPQKRDRSFLHYPGTNALFGAEHVDYETVSRAKIFHLGYPPIMPQLIKDQGFELQSIYSRIKSAGVVTSMDMVVPDPNGPSGKADWKAILQNVLPYVDIFIPSIDEALYMLRRKDYDLWKDDVLSHLTREYLFELSEELIDMGVVVAGFKLGEMGIYLRTAEKSSLDRLSKLSIDIDEWAEIETWQAAFKVQVASTNGAGDAAYAGFLAAMQRGLSPDECLQWANAVGACNVEKVDATSGVQTWEETESRLENEWPIREMRLTGIRRIDTVLQNVPTLSF